MNNEELVKQIQEGNDVKNNLSELYKQNKRIFYKWVKPYSTFASCITIEDLMQECYFGMVKAVEQFDMSKGFKFTTYAESKIKTDCIRYVHSLEHIKKLPEQVCNNLMKYKKIVEEYGEVPDDETLRIELGLTVKQFKQFKEVLNEDEVVSLDANIQYDSDIKLCDTIPDQTDIEQDFIDKEVKKELWDSVDKLEQEKKTVILARYKNDEIFRIVSEKMNKSIGYVRKLERDALKDLKKMDSVKYIYDYDCTDAYLNSRLSMEKGEGSQVERLALRKIDYDENHQREY